MRILGWAVSMVEVAVLSLQSRFRRLFSWLPTKGNGRNEEIRSAVEIAVGISNLAGVNRSFVDYLAKATPANVLMHYGTMYTLILLFGRVKGFSDSAKVEALEMALVHDYFEREQEGLDKPHYDRDKLPKSLQERLITLSKKRPPRNEHTLESRTWRYKRYLPRMEELTEGLEPSFREWMLERFRQFYLDETPQAQLARICDRLSDAFLAPWYVKLGEKVRDFLRWGRYRSRLDADLHLAVKFLELYYEAPDEEREN